MMHERCQILGSIIEALWRCDLNCEIYWKGKCKEKEEEN
jgi:hypothetical protein